MIEVTVGDTGPDRTLTIFDNDTGLVADLTNMVSAQAKFRLKGTLATLATLALAVVAPATNGNLLLVWGSTLAAVAAGYYELEISYTLSGGKICTAQNTLDVQVKDQFA